MEPHRQQRADLAIQAFRTQVLMLTTVVESLTAGLERAAADAAKRNPTDVVALVNRLEETNPILAVLVEELRAKAASAFGKPPDGADAIPATIHGVRNALHTVTLYSSVLNEQLTKLGTAQKQGASLPVNLETLGAAAQTMGRELASWSKDIDSWLSKPDAAKGDRPKRPHASSGS